MGYYLGFNPPTAYPFYFPFSFVIFICGILVFINYTEKNGYWRVLLSAILLFISYLFYENYLVFTLIFGCYILIRNWRRSGFFALWKSKTFYKEAVPYAVALILYVACYYGSIACVGYHLVLYRSNGGGTYQYVQFLQGDEQPHILQPSRKDLLFRGNQNTD